MPSILRWLPKALPVAQVAKAVVGGTWVAADTITATSGSGKALVLTIGATVTTTAIATALKEMINGDTATGNATRSETGDNVPEIAEIDATVSGSTVTFTSDKGRPFTLTITKSSTSGTVNNSTPTAATGPNHWDNTANWDTGALPADGDTVNIDNSDVSILHGLDQSAIELAELNIAQSFTGTIGLPEVNTDGDEYLEYRPQYLSIGPLVLRIGAGAGNGSGRIKINSTADPCAATIFNTGDPLDNDLPAVLWKGTDSGNALVQTGGSVGVAIYGGETATLATITKSGGALVLGAGVTLSGAIQHKGGALEVNSLIDGSLTQTAGDTVINGTGNVDQLTLRGGTCVYNTTGTLGGNTIVSGNAVLDFTQNPVAKAVTNPIDIYGTAAVVDDTNKVLGPVVVDFNEGAGQSQFRFGQQVRLTRGTPA